MADYGQTYAFGTANTAQFQNAMEDFSGKDLDWFFDQWVYSPNYPNYRWSWVYAGIGNIYYLDIKISQRQGAPAVYTMPVELKLSILAKDTLLLIHDTLPD